MIPPGPPGTGTPRSRAGEIPTELLLGVARAAGCPVVLETPGDTASHAAEIALLRQSLG